MFIRPKDQEEQEKNLKVSLPINVYNLLWKLRTTTGTNISDIVTDAVVEYCSQNGFLANDNNDNEERQ